MIGHGPGQDHGQIGPAGDGAGDDRGQLFELPPFVGAGRIAGSDEEDVDVAVEQAVREVERVGAVEGRCERPPAGAPGRRHQRLPGPLRDRRHEDRPLRCAPGDQSRKLGGEPGRVDRSVVVGQADRGAQLRIGRGHAPDELDDQAVGAAGRGHGQ